MTQMTQGNTCDVILNSVAGPEKPKTVRSRIWTLTINNPNDTDDTALKEIWKYHYQYEIGENGTRHIQGVIKYKNAVSFESVKKQFPTAHIERCRNLKASINYCSKSETSTGERYSNMVENIIIDYWKDELAKPWQHYILDLLKQEPDNRTVHWFWEPNGGVGKTTLVRHYCMNNKDNAIMVNGGMKDILSAVAEFVLEHEYGPKVVFFNIPRSKGISYTAIESLKDGIFFSTKYHSSMCIINPPHVIVFANDEPILEKLSLDRWQVHRIT